jgi:hypothetical protein
VRPNPGLCTVVIIHYYTFFSNDLLLLWLQKFLSRSSAYIDGQEISWNLRFWWQWRCQLWFFLLLWNLKDCYHVNKCPLLVPILSQLDPVHSFIFCSSQSIVILPSHLRIHFPSGPPRRFLGQCVVCISHLLHCVTCHIILLDNFDVVNRCIRENEWKSLSAPPLSNTSKCHNN